MSHITINFRSKTLNMPVMLDVLLPENSSDCKTLYLLHGWGGDRESFLLRTRLAEYVEGKAIAVVMPSGNNKFFVNNINGKAYQDFVAKELIAQMETWFKVSRSLKDRFIAGADMGGFGALSAAVDCPGTYHTAFSYSGPFELQEQCETLHERDRMPVFGEWKKASEAVLELAVKLEEAEGSDTRYIICSKETSKKEGWGYLNDCIKKTVEYIAAGGDMIWQ